MATSPTYEDFRKAGALEILRVPTRFASAAVSTRGSDVNIAIAAAASMADEVGAFAQRAFNEVHLSTAAKVGGEVLDRNVWDRNGVVREDAQQSVVPLQFSKTQTTFAVPIDVGTVVATGTGQTFETLSQIVLGVNVLGPITVHAQAQTTGEASNVDKDTIRTVVTRLIDGGVTVNNAEPAAGGGPAEDDPTMAARSRDLDANSRRGTRLAIEIGASTTEGVTQATVTEDLTSDGISGFRVRAIISDLDGQANSALAARVVTNLENFRALGVPVQVVSGTPQLVEIEITGAIFLAGSDTAAVIDQMRAQVVSAVNQGDPGKILRRQVIFAALVVENLVEVPESALIAPGGDLSPTTESSVIRTSPALVSINGQVGS